MAGNRQVDEVYSTDPEIPGQATSPNPYSLVQVSLNPSSTETACYATRPTAKFGVLNNSYLIRFSLSPSAKLLKWLRFY